MNIFGFLPNIYNFLTDPSPGGCQDENPIVRWLIPKCAIFPGNFWTSLRIFGVVPVIWLFGWSPWASFIAFLFFAITDWIDGKVARERKEANGVGVWFDPTADKIFIIPIFWWLGLYKSSLLNSWLFWLLVAVEAGGRLIILIFWKFQGKLITKDEVKAKWWGKVKFGLQIALGVGLYGPWLAPAVWWQGFFNVMFLVIMVFAIISVASHIWRIPEPHRRSHLN